MQFIHFSVPTHFQAHKILDQQEKRENHMIIQNHGDLPKQTYINCLKCNGAYISGLYTLDI